MFKAPFLLPHNRMWGFSLIVLTLAQLQHLSLYFPCPQLYLLTHFSTNWTLYALYCTTNPDKARSHIVSEFSASLFCPFQENMPPLSWTDQVTLLYYYLSSNVLIFSLYHHFNSTPFDVHFMTMFSVALAHSLPRTYLPCTQCASDNNGMSI